MFTSHPRQLLKNGDIHKLHSCCLGYVHYFIQHSVHNFILGCMIPFLGTLFRIMFYIQRYRYSCQATFFHMLYLHQVQYFMQGTKFCTRYKIGYIVSIISNRVFQSKVQYFMPCRYKISYRFRNCLFVPM
jgi:hypothetical protein